MSFQRNFKFSFFFFENFSTSENNKLFNSKIHFFSFSFINWNLIFFHPPFVYFCADFHLSLSSSFRISRVYGILNTILIRISKNESKTKWPSPFHSGYRSSWWSSAIAKARLIINFVELICFEHLIHSFNQVELNFFLLFLPICRCMHAILYTVLDVC